MAFIRKVWKNRISEFFNRYRMEDASTGTSKDVTLTLNDGTVIQEGDALTSEALNDLEARIQYGFETSGGIASVNPNYFDNAWFTINQRNATTVTSNNGYIADRWKLENVSAETGVGATISDDEITLVTYNGDGLKQILPANILKAGKTYIISAILDGVVVSKSFEWQDTDITDTYVDSDYSFSIVKGEGILTIYPVIQYSGSLKTVVIKAVKLEVGEISTIEMEKVPDYATEMAKCMTRTCDTNDTYSQRPSIVPNGYRSSHSYNGISIGNQTTASGNNSFAQGYKSKALQNYSVAIGNQGTAYVQDTTEGADQPCEFAIGGTRSTLIKTANVVTQEKVQNSIKNTKNVMDVDLRGNIYSTGARYLVRGYVKGRLIANPDTVILEDGAIYMLHATTRLNTGNFRGAQSYMIASVWNPAGQGIATTAQATPKIAALGVVGTVGCNLSALTEPYVNGVGTTVYRSKLGIACCTTACRTRYTLVKISGSEDDFAGITE